MGRTWAGAQCHAVPGSWPLEWYWDWSATGFVPPQAQINIVCSYSPLYNSDASQFWHWKWIAEENPCNATDSAGASLVDTPTVGTICDCDGGTIDVYDIWFGRCAPFTPTWTIS